MGIAIERAVSGRTWREKKAATRWAAAWGLACDTRSDLPSSQTEASVSSLTH